MMRVSFDRHLRGVMDEVVAMGSMVGKTVRRSPLITP